MNSLTVKRVLMTFAGIFLAGVSVAIFKASDFGTDPNSCFVMGVWNLAGIKYSYVYIAINALILDKRTRIPFRMCRIGTDVITTAAGFFMGAVVGAGTLVTAFFMGPLIEFFNRTVARPFLYGKEKKQIRKQ